MDDLKKFSNLPQYAAGEGACPVKTVRFRYLKKNWKMFAQTYDVKITKLQGKYWVKNFILKADRFPPYMPLGNTCSLFEIR